MIWTCACATHLPGRPRCGCWLRTCHISDACWWEPTECAGFSLSSLPWWVTGACSLKTQHTGEQEADQNAFGKFYITHAAQSCTIKLKLLFFLSCDRYDTSDHLWACISEGAVPLRRWPTRAKLKLALKFKPTKWSICLQCHSNGRLISMNTSSGLWTRRMIYCKNETLKMLHSRNWKNVLRTPALWCGVACYLVVKDPHGVQSMEVLLQQSGSSGVKVDLVQLKNGDRHPEQSFVHGGLLQRRTMEPRSIHFNSNQHL